MPRVFADPLRERAARTAAILSLDAACSMAALVAAMVLRFEDGLPPPYPEILPATLGLLVAARLATNGAARLHRWTFRLEGEGEAVRLASAALGGSVLFVALVEVVLAPGLPRTVYALEFFLSSTGFTLLRFGPRSALRWWRELARRRRSDATPALVVGVSFGAELLARDIVRSPRSPYEVAGFVATDASEIGRRIEGKRVVGTVESLAALVERHRVRTVLLAIPRPAAARLRDVIAACASRGVRFRILAAAASLAEPVSAAMLDDLAPEDLLPRPPAGPGHGELRRRVEGRRALVTGAAGGVGGEICRQLVHHGVRQVVMVDADEDELWRRARRLAAEQPDVDVRAEVADLRGAAALARLSERYRPEYVFHAAERGGAPAAGAPGMAADDDALRTRNVARMARACGARRLVLVCTGAAGDAAPEPPPGAELAALELARSPLTELATVRLGNVLAPAGPAPGPAAAACPAGLVAQAGRAPRLVTIPEAARVVLVAGLDERREATIEDVGAPVELGELARLALALSGRDGREAGA